MIVQSTVYDRLVRDMTNRVKLMKVGPPLESLVDVGAITMTAQVYRSFMILKRLNVAKVGQGG